MEATVTLVAEGRGFPCSRDKLMAASDYFRAMFSNDFTERTKNTVELQDIDADCLHTLLQYVEDGTYSVTSDNRLPLLQTAAMLQFSQIQRECEQQILEALSCESCLEVYLVTAALGLATVADAALTIALWNFSDICKRPQFLQLSVHELVEYVGHPGLSPGPEGEWVVWEALVAWIEEDEGERSGELTRLMDCLDFTALTEQDVSNMLFYSCVSENDTIVKVLENIRTVKKEQFRQRIYPSESESDKESQGESRDECSSEVREMTARTLSRPGRKPPQLPCVVGFERSCSTRRRKAKTSDDEEELEMRTSRVRNSEMVPVLYSFSAETGTVRREVALTKLCAGPVACAGYQVCALGPSVYILGGEYLYGNGNWNKSVWRYSTATRKWIVEQALPQPRRHHMACVVDRVIYLVGGYGKYRVVQSSVDALDTTTGEWHRCPDMPHCVSHGAVCSHQGRLLVFTQEMQLLSYYPRLRKWSAIPIAAASKQGYRAALSWGDAVYLVDNCSNKVYEFLPEAGHAIHYFGQFRKAPANVCVVDGKIYNFSHDDMDDSHVVEVLDIAAIREARRKGGREVDEERKGGREAEGNKSHKENSGRDEAMEEESPRVEKDIEARETNREARETNSETRSRNREAGNRSNEARDRSKETRDRSKHRPQQIVYATQVFHERDEGPHLFTTKCPADTTFSLGCFPLMKLGR